MHRSQFPHIHHTRGRLRLRTARLKQQPHLARQAEHALAALDGVTTVRASAVTGSILVEYTPHLIDAAALERAAAHTCAGLNLGAARPEDTPAQRLLTRAAEHCIERAALALFALIL
jgi:hypothetical protein